jgi:hypothetical protein
MTRLIAISLLALVGACHRGGSGGGGGFDDTRRAVQQYFQFAEAGDCARLQPLMAKPEECENIVRQFNETKTHLVSIDDAKVDGRDASVVLVYTTVVFGKKDNHKWIVRAAHVGDAWKVRL